MPAFRPVAVLAATLVLAPAAARAQGACDINEGSPYQVNSARLYLSKVGSGKSAETQTQLKNAVRVLTQGNTDFGNPAGRNFLLGRALYEWTRISPYDSTFSAPRSELGYASAGPATVDLAAAIDTALTAVDRAQPGCVSKTAPIRAYVYSRLYNRAVAMSQTENVDSARKLVARAQLVNPTAVGPYQLLAIIAQKTGDQDAMLQSYATVLSKTQAGDTATAAYRKTAMYNSAVLLQQQAAAASGAAKQPLNDRSVALFKQYATEFADDPNAAAGLAKAQLASGDTAAVSGVFATMIASPDKYTDVQLFEAGTNAEVAGKHTAAQQLLEAGLKKNPFYRDALFNLANSYYVSKNVDGMLPIARRLLAVDANNPQNYKLMAGAFQLKARGTTDPKLKKSAQDSVLHFIEASDKMKRQVTVSTFTHASTGKHTVGGTVKNLDTAPASYDLTVEFLDASGTAVGTATSKVGPVAPQASQPFSVNVTQPGVVAYRVKIGA